MKYLLQILLCILTQMVVAQTQFIPAMDVHIKYIGRWHSLVMQQDSLMESAWSGAYFKTGISGGSLSLILAKSVAKLHVTIDDQPGVFYSQVKDTLLLTPAHLPQGRHTIRVAASNEHEQLCVRGLEIENGQSLAPEIHPLLIEFVGNSITAGGGSSGGSQTSFAWLAAELLPAENVRICTSGIMLVSGIDFKNQWMVGMEDAYFKKVERINQDLNWYLSHEADWNFRDYQPDCIVLNLGTNDRNEPEIHKQLCTPVYVRFLQRIREKNPKAQIIVLPTFLECNNQSLHEIKPYITAAVAQAQAMGVENLRLVDTKGWIEQSDLQDGLHPNDTGMQKIAARLAEVFKSYLKEKE